MTPFPAAWSAELQQNYYVVLTLMGGRSRIFIIRMTLTVEQRPTDEG